LPLLLVDAVRALGGAAAFRLVAVRRPPLDKLGLGEDEGGQETQELLQVH